MASPRPSTSKNISESHTSSEEEQAISKKRKFTKKSCVQKYNVNWEKEPEFRGWLQCSKKGAIYAHCKACNKDFVCGVTICSIVCSFMMQRLTPLDRLEVIKKYYQSGSSIVGTQRLFTRELGRRHRYSAQVIRRTVEKFESQLTLQDNKQPKRQRNVRSDENIAATAASVVDEPNLSISRRSQQLGLSQTSTWRILRKDLGLHPYKVVLTQELKPNDHRLRREFVDWALEHLEHDPDFDKKIIFSDEAHFWLNGCVNKQNCRYWCEDNPEVLHEVPLHSEKLTVGCGLWYGGVIGPYFFRNENGTAITVNGDRYRTMLLEFLWPELENINIEEMWFQQDGATCHTAEATLALLREKFGDWIISRRGFVNWPPRSCDLTPLDYFLWGYVKAQVYANKPQSLDHLEENIRQVIGEIQPELLHRVIRNWSDRLRQCQRARCGHLNNILFHT